MGKLSNMLLMAIRLQKGDVVSIETLSDLLEITPRQVRRYRDALESSGFIIHSKPGKNGGYYLDEAFDHTLPLDLKASPADQQFAALFSDDELDDAPSLLKAYALFKREMDIETFIIGNHPLSELKVFVKIFQALDSERTVDIEYVTIHGDVYKKGLKPYFTFKKHGIYYLAALDPTKNTIIYLRLLKMKRVILNDDAYRIDQSLLTQEKALVKKNNGVFFKDRLNTAKVIIDASLKDTIDAIFEGTVGIESTKKDGVLVTLHYGSMEELMHSLLAFGSKVRVLAPKRLRARHIAELKSALSLYEERDMDG